MLNLQILVMSAVMNENEEIKKKSIYEDVFVILHPFYLQKKEHYYVKYKIIQWEIVRNNMNIFLCNLTMTLKYKNKM